MSLIQRGIRILKEEGPFKLVTKTGNKFISPVYWAVRRSYTLSIQDITVRFSAPNRKVVRRTKRRFESEKDELVGLMDELEKDDVFYDIGANTGLYTLFASKRCTEGTVIAFEPYPPNVAMLKRDISRNGVDNVDVYELALSDSEGMMSFSQPEQPDVGYGSASVEVDPSESTSEIPTATGDDLISKGKIPAPNVVKIDVEGAESLVMEGIEEALSSPTCRLVYCEVHLPGVGHRPSSEAFGATKDDIQDQLEELGFTIQDEQSRDNEVALKAVK